MAPRVWLDLERLEALPLDRTSRIILWRHWQALIPPPSAGPGQGTLFAALERRLLEDELGRCLDLAAAEAWLEALRRLESLLPELETQAMQADLEPVLSEVLISLHRALVVEERALAAEDRAELLWQGHRWFERGGVAALPPMDWLTLMREQICRHGALVWLELVEAADGPNQRAQARRRALVLLEALASFWDPCPDWIPQFFRKGVQEACAPEARAHHPLAERMAWALTMARLEPDPGERERLRRTLGPAQAAFEVGRVLRLASFTEPSLPPD